MTNAEPLADLLGAARAKKPVWLSNVLAFSCEAAHWMPKWLQDAARLRLLQRRVRRLGLRSRQKRVSGSQVSPRVPQTAELHRPHVRDEMIAQDGTPLEVVERDRFLDRDVRRARIDGDSTLGKEGERIGQRVRAHPIP